MRQRTVALIKNLAVVLPGFTVEELYHVAEALRNALRDGGSTSTPEANALVAAMLAELHELRKLIYSGDCSETEIAPGEVYDCAPCQVEHRAPAAE